MYSNSKNSWDEVNLIFLAGFVLLGIASIWNLFFMVAMTIYSILWMMVYIYKNIDNRPTNKTSSWFGWNNPRKFFFFYGFFFYIWILISVMFVPYGWSACSIVTTCFHHIMTVIWILSKNDVKKTCVREKELMLKIRYFNVEHNFAALNIWFGEFYTHPSINRMKSDAKTLGIFLTTQMQKEVKS